MNKKFIKVAAVLCLLTGCTSSTVSSSSQNTQNETAGENTNTETKKDTIEIPGAQIVQNNTIDLSKFNTPVEINKSGTYDLSGAFASMLIIDADGNVNLNLINVSIKSSEGPCIYIRKAEQVTIRANGESSLNMDNTKYDELNACVYSKADLIFDGNGQLNIDSSYHGIKAKDTFTSSNLSLIVNSSKDGIHSNETLTMKSGNYEITSLEDEAVQSETDLSIEGGTFNLDSKSDGLRAENELNIKDGNIDITTENEGIESKNTLTIDNGNISILSMDDGLNAANTLTINNGNIQIVSQTNDGIDSNGSLIINGGTIFSSGMNPPEQAFDTDNTPFEINGGDVIGIGSAVIQPSSSKQNVIIAGQYSNISKIMLKQDDNVILEKNMNNSSSNGFSSGSITLSSEKIKTGNTYDLYINEELVESITVESQITTAGNTNEMNSGQKGPGQMPGNAEPPFGEPGQPPMERRNS